MLEQDATVVKVSADQAWVEAVSRSSCSSCSAGSCSTSVVSRLFGLKKNMLQINNTLQAQIGDQVTIGIPDSVLIKASLWAYMVPLICMLLSTAFPALMGYGNSVQVLSALAGLSAGMWLVGRLTRPGKKSASFDPILLRIKGQREIYIDPKSI